MKKLIWLFIMTGIILSMLVLVPACSETTAVSNTPIKSSPSQIISSSPVSNKNYDNIATVGIVTHNHWTQDDINDGQIVWVGLVNTRNVSISDDIRGLTVDLSVKGSDGTTKDLTVPLFEKTYTNVNLRDSDYPQGQGFIIYFNELNGYEKMSFAAIWATVTLPDGRIVKNHDPYSFSIKPVTYNK